MDPVIVEDGIDKFSDRVATSHYAWCVAYEYSQQHDEDLHVHR
jgi:hypothetical protein